MTDRRMLTEEALRRIVRVHEEWVVAFQFIGLPFSPRFFGEVIHNRYEEEAMVIGFDRMHHLS